MITMDFKCYNTVKHILSVSLIIKAERETHMPELKGTVLVMSFFIPSLTRMLI